MTSLIRYVGLPQPLATFASTSSSGAHLPLMTS